MMGHEGKGDAFYCLSVGLGVSHKMGGIERNYGTDVLFGQDRAN